MRLLCMQLHVYIFFSLPLVLTFFLSLSPPSFTPPPPTPTPPSLLPSVLHSPCFPLPSFCSPLTPPEQVSFGRDFEQQLGFYVEARANFSNLDQVLIFLIHVSRIL